jgi:hypothetical protein
MAQSHTFYSMYKAPMLSISRVLYRRQVTQCIQQLEYLEFNADDVETFQEISKKDAAKLTETGIDMFKKTPGEVPFLKQMVQCTMDSSHDEWLFPLRSAIKTVAINTGQLEMLPWERLIFKVRCIGKRQARTENKR